MRGKIVQEILASEGSDLMDKMRELFTAKEID